MRIPFCMVWNQEGRGLQGFQMLHPPTWGSSHRFSWGQGWMSRILLPSEKRDLHVYCKSMINSIISPIPVFCIKYSMTLWKQRFYCSVYVKEMGPWVTHAAPLLIVRFLWSPCSQPGLGLQLCYVHCVSISIVWWLDVRSLVVFPSLKVSCFHFQGCLQLTEIL